MEAIRVAPGSNEESCRCVWSYAKALHQGWGYRPGESLQLGLQVLSLLTELTVAAGKGPKSTLGRRHGPVHTTGPKVLAPGDKGGSSEATQGLTKFGRGRDDQGLIWLKAWVRALTAESLALLSIRIISTSPSPDLGVALATPASTARAAAISASVGSL